LKLRQQNRSACMASQYEALLGQARLVRVNTVKPIPASALKADFVIAELVAARPGRDFGCSTD
jgi:hypothetical protein